MKRFAFLDSPSEDTVYRPLEVFQIYVMGRNIYTFFLGGGGWGGGSRDGAVVRALTHLPPM